MTFTKEQLTRIIESADEVITALAGTNDDIHPDNSTKMCAAWDDLNDRNAPPSVVKRLAELALAGMEAEPVAWKVAFKLEGQPGSNCDKIFESRPAMNNVVSLHERGGFIVNVMPLYKAPHPLTTSERAELENYRNAQQVVPDELANKSFEYIANKFQVSISDAQWILVGWNACRAAMLQGKADGNSPVIQEGWVACSERMPGHSKTFLALTAFGEYWTGYFDRTDVFWCDETKVENVTHWMPLPAAPQQEVKP